MTYNLFELIMPKIEFDKNKPIKLFEAFAGIGTQAMALKKLGVEIDHIGISEIDKYALMSYKAIHGKVKNYGDISKIKGGN
ncbi:MAG: DNA cytosine methyltransferase [Sulfurimonadaceae bacterium]|jgi:DNA (cytosine-5)-methyltransferase 1|nr:DNA cytosine methyltransferase [Sulfurimonadaceae bacterium]